MPVPCLQPSSYPVRHGRTPGLPRSSWFRLMDAPATSSVVSSQSGAIIATGLRAGTRLFLGIAACRASRLAAKMTWCRRPRGLTSSSQSGGCRLFVTAWTRARTAASSPIATASGFRFCCLRMGRRWQQSARESPNSAAIELVAAPDDDHIRNEGLRQIRHSGSLAPSSGISTTTGRLCSGSEVRSSDIPSTRTCFRSLISTGAIPRFLEMSFFDI